MVNERDLEKLKDILKEVLKEKAEELPKIEFSQKSYDALFPRGRIQTPIENVKLGSHQFEKLDAKKRQFILGAVHGVLHTPDLIIDELRKNVFGTEEKSHVYAKSYLIANKSKGIQSVVVVIGDDNVSISTHERDINNLVNKIKMPEQILYKSSEIGQLISQRIQKEQSIANPTVATNDHDNIVSQSEKISTEKIQFQINSIQGEKTMANENTQAMENTNEELLTPEQFLKNLCARADIEVIEDTSIMRSILDAGKNVQKMAVKYGTNQDIQSEESFNGFGTYVVSVNEENAKQLGIKIAARKYGGTFYINDQPFNEFLQEKNFSPYWTKRLEQFKGNDIDSLTSDFINADVKGNAALQKEHEAITTLFSLDLIEYKREQTFLYSVDIPDNDNTNYLLYNNPIGIENANRINEQLEKLNVDWRVSRNDIGKNIYFDVLAKNVFNGSQKQTSEFLKNCGYVGMQMDSSNYIVFNDRDMSISNRVQYMIDGENNIYGFAYDGKIYADPEIATSNTYAHEYTHLWDSYTKETNPELWQEGKDIFKGTSLWEEVLADENYRNLSNDDEILSECHARIVGKMAEAVLNKIAEKDGGLKKDQVIDWDKECQEYIMTEFVDEYGIDELSSQTWQDISDFMSQPMKDLMDGVKISQIINNNFALKFEQQNKQVFYEVDNFLDNGIRPKNDEFIFKSVPEILNYSGISQNEIVIKTSVINYAIKTHNLSKETIRNSIRKLADPVLVFDTDKTASENKKDSVIILTDVFEKNDKPTALTMNLDSDYERGRRILSVNQITSIHDRTLIAKNGTDLIEKWVNDGNCRYVDDKKISDWQQAAGVYFPLAVLQSDNSNIYTKSDFVNQTIQKQDISDFMSQPMKDLIDGVKINQILNYEINSISQEMTFENNIHSFKEARELLKEKQGHIYKNDITGMEASFTRTSLDKFMSGKAWHKSKNLQSHLAAATNFDKIFKNAELLSVEDGHKKGINQSFKFYSGFNFDGETLLAKLTVNELSQNQGNRIYNVEAIEVERVIERSLENEQKRPDGIQSSPNELSVQAKALHQVYGLKIEQLLTKVNPEMKKYFNQTLNKGIQKQVEPVLPRIIDHTTKEYMANKELGKKIWDRMKFNVGDYYAEDFEAWYNDCFAACMEEVVNNYFANDHKSVEDWKDGWFLELSARQTKSGETETISFEKENFIEFYGEEYCKEMFEPEEFHNNNPLYTPPTDEEIQAEKEAHEAYIQLFFDSYNNPHDSVELYEVLDSFSKIESEKWNLSAENKVAVARLIDVSQIKGDDKNKTIENLNNYLLSEEYQREESNYAKILTPVLLSYNQENKNFDFAFSTDDIKKQEPEPVEIPEKKGEIKSIVGNAFTGGNVEITQKFQEELIAKGIVNAQDEFILVNELEANANGTKVKENEPYVMLTTPVEVDGVKHFVGTKYYHVSSLEEPQKIEKKTEPKNKEQDKSKADKDVIIYGKTKVPEFAMMTNHGFENFKNMIVDSREESSNSYLLKSEDGKNSVRVTAATLKELMSEPYQAKAKSYNDEMKIQDKMIESQYQDFFKQRSNCANNFRHNLSVYCRKEANSPLDSLKIANSLIKQMSKEEKHKTKELLKTLRKEGQTINEVLIETYNGAVKEVPLNEEYLNNKRYDKMIARPMYDTLSGKGEKIDRDFDLRIGDSVKIQFKANKFFGKGKESISSEVTIISSSKEGNLVTLMDGKKSFYDVPRDTFLKEYAHQEIKERKAQAKEFKHHSMQMEIGR